MTSNEFRRHLFDRPLKVTAWYRDVDYEDLDLPIHQCVILATGVFLDIEQIADAYSEQQVAHGLRYLIDPFGGLGDIYMDSQVNETLRSTAIESMLNVFDRLFPLHCLSHKTHPKLDEGDAPYDNLCYMWWDIFPRHGHPQREDMKLIDAAVLQTLAKVIQIENIACQESALHGLGHWQSARPQEVGKIIGTALPRLPSQLLTLARNAITGHVQ